MFNQGVGLAARVLERANALLGSDADTHTAYSFDDLCALIAAAGGMHRSSPQPKQESEWAAGPDAAAEEGDDKDATDVSELDLLLRLLHKPAELRTDRELAMLDDRWAVRFEWFRQLTPSLRREMCRYVRGGALRTGASDRLRTFARLSLGCVFTPMAAVRLSLIHI